MGGEPEPTVRLANIHGQHFTIHTILSLLNASQLFTVSTYLSTVLFLLYSLSVKKGRKNASQLFTVSTDLPTILSLLYSL
jgi:hypothetical protein